MYISNVRRAIVNPYVAAIVAKAREVGATKADIAYMLSEIALGVARPATGWTYSAISDVISMLRDPADEIARRCLGGLGDATIHVNGDNPQMNQAKIDIQAVYDGILNP